MQTYICKCGKTFEKSTKAETTGYVLNDYSEQHECYGCPFIVTERDWVTKEVVKRECRATPKITYLTRCCIRTGKGDFSACKLYSLDLAFVRQVMDYINSLDGIEKTEFGNRIPDKWRASDFGQCYSFSDCFGLAIFDLNFQKNKKGTEARRLVKERFFYIDGSRRDMTEESERKTVLMCIQNAKENAGNKMIVVEQTTKKTEVTTMATFDISTMLAAPQAVMPEQYTQAAQLHAEIINCAKTAQENLYQMAMGFKKMRDEKLYIALGYDNFGDYCEKKAELSRQNVYQYIKVVENLPKDFVLSTRQIGKEKMYLLSTISEAEREEIVETTDLEKTTVQKLKEKIKELESRSAETVKASEADKRQLAERDEEINRLKGENIKLQNRDQKSTAELAAEAAKTEELKAEKQRLEQLLKEAQSRKSEKLEIVGDPADKEKIACLEAQIKDFESRPVDVIYEKNEVEINRLKDRISELEKELEAEAEEKPAQSDIKVFAVRLTLDSFEKLIDVMNECGDPVLKDAVMKAQILRV